MNTVVYCHPFVPPEWIAAHDFRPHWPTLRTATEGATAYAQRGVCPAAEAVMAVVSRQCPATPLVLTTTCDQMRRAAGVLEKSHTAPVFLMHVPRTWQTAAARSLYREELLRLGEFLVECGGQTPTLETIRHEMLRYDRARSELRRLRGGMSAREFAEAVIYVRGNPTTDGGQWSVVSGQRNIGSEALPISNPQSLIPNPSSTSPHPNPLQKGEGTNFGIPLALLGGPMLESDFDLLDHLENVGGRVVLDATESGQRTLPAPFGAERLSADPVEELVRAYFDAIPDVFRVPNDRLHQWLREQIAWRNVRGIILRRHIWCDLWHGELSRLRNECGVPVLDWDSGDGGSSGATGRIEAFLEALR